MEDPIIEESYGEDRDAVYNSLDDREALERQLADPQHEAALTLTRWRHGMREVTTEEGVRDLINTLGANIWNPVEGTSWTRWATWFEGRLEEAAEQPHSILERAELPSRSMWRRRSTTALTPHQEKRLARAAIRAHSERVNAWLAAGDDASLQLYLLHDAAEVQGDVQDLGPSDMYGRQEVLASRISTRIGVRLSRSVTGNGMHAVIRGVCVAEPMDDPRADAWRTRWPALGAVLGGYFSDHPQMMPSMNQQSMLFTEPPAFLERLAAEGDELLTLADDDLHAAVVALGSFVEPPHLRLWLTWMFWRIRTFDWDPDNLAP